MESESIFVAMRRRWWVVALLVLIGAAVGAIPSQAKVEEENPETLTNYSARHTTLLSNTSPTESIFNDSVLFNQIQLFATVGEVPRRVAERLGYEGPPAELASEVTVEVDSSTGAVRFSTTQDDPERAVELADAFAEELTTYLSERQDELQLARITAARERTDKLKVEVDDAQDRLTFDPDNAALQAELDAFSRQYSTAFEQLSQLEEVQGQLQLTTLERAEAIAEVTTTSQGLSAPTSRLSRGVLLGIVGLIVGIGVVVVLARLDRRIRTKQQAEAIFGMRSQVNIPPLPRKAAPGVVVTPERHDTLSDSYRTLRSVVGFVEGGEAAKQERAAVTLVVSPGPGDGKTSVASNLAAAFVESGARTIAVNTDFRRPTLGTRLLGHKPEPVANGMDELAALEVDDMLLPTETPDLVLLDLAGTNVPPGDLARFTGAIIPGLAKHADEIVIDSSPVGATAEVLELVPFADVIVFVVRLGHTSIPAATRTIEIIRSLTEAHLLLAVNGDGPEKTSYYYEYSGSPKKHFWQRSK